MDRSLIGLFSVLGTAIITALSSYFIAARKLSGKIGSSEAADLWAESTAMRVDYRERIAAAERRTVTLEERVAQLEQDKANLVTMVRDLQVALEKERHSD